MSVTSYQEIPQYRTLNATDGGERQYVRSFWVYSNSNTDDPYSISVGWSSSANIYRGTQHPSDNTAFAVASQVKFIGNNDHNADSSKLAVWQVDVTYSNKRNKYNDPLNDPPKINWGGRTYNR